MAHVSWARPRADPDAPSLYGDIVDSGLLALGEGGVVGFNGVSLIDRCARVWGYLRSHGLDRAGRFETPSSKSIKFTRSPQSRVRADRSRGGTKGGRLSQLWGWQMVPRDSTLGSQSLRY